ncbi:MAG: hypothetical protein ABI401_02565 [Candidatus Dormibacter sp.]
MSDASPFKVGVTIHPQQCTIQELRDAWRRADDLEFARKSAILDQWCERVGRNPKEIERTANVGPTTPKLVEGWLAAGLQHFALRLAQPFDTKAVERLIKVRDS